MRRVNPGAAVLAGIIAALVFVMLEMVLVATVGGESPWGPPRMIAAIGMGQSVLPPPATFDLTVFSVAILIHMVLSIVLAFVFAAITARMNWGLGMMLVAGAVFGLALYLVNFYGFTAFFPWFAMARNSISIFAHVMFGVTLAFAYHRLARRAVVSV